MAPAIVIVLFSAESCWSVGVPTVTDPRQNSRCNMGRCDKRRILKNYSQNGLGSRAIVADSVASSRTVPTPPAMSGEPVAAIVMSEKRDGGTTRRRVRQLLLELRRRVLH